MRFFVWIFLLGSYYNNYTYHLPFNLFHIKHFNLTDYNNVRNPSFIHFSSSYFLLSSSNSFVLVLWIEWQISLDNLNIWTTSGSLRFNLLIKLKLVGSRINCVRVSGFSEICWKSKLPLEALQSSAISSLILFLIGLKAVKIAMIWHSVSFSFQQILHKGFPLFVWSNFVWYVK